MSGVPYTPPVPTPLIGPIPPGEPYPAAELGPLDAVARAVHDKVQAPLAIGAQSALGVTALAVQGHANVETLGGEAPVSLFVLTLAVSGERKSSCDRLLMAPVHAFQRRLKDEFREATFRHEADLAIWDAKRAELLKHVRKSDPVAEADLRSLGAAPDPPLSPVIIPGDPTYEGLVKLLDRGRPSLGLFNDEAGLFVGGHAMSKENRLKTMAGLSQLWGGDPINRTRSGDGADSLYGRRLSAHLMIQPAAAIGLVDDPLAQAQGFLPRFLISHPNSTIGSRIATSHRAESDAAIEQFHARIASLLRRDLPLKEGSRNELTPRLLPLSAGAREMLAAFHRRIEAAQRPDEELSSLTAFASKIAEQSARIAAVLTLFENLEAGEVPIERMANGIELAQYYLGEAVRLVRHGHIPEDVANAEALRQWLKARWTEDYVSARIVMNRGPHRLRNAKKVRAALSILESNDWITRVDRPLEVGGERSREVWHLHDLLRKPDKAA